MSLDERHFRDALGQFATGVCLVSTVNREGHAIAITVNSFASVSLDPPLVLWSLQKDADTYDDYLAADNFSIAVLSEDQQGHAKSYAQKHNHRLAPEHYVLGEQGIPLVREALVSFECRLERALDGGDHTILLGRVTQIAEATDAPPLLFHAGRYGQLQ